MRVKRVTIEEKKIKSFLVPDHLDLDGKSIAEIYAEIDRITESKEPLIVEDREINDVSVNEENVEGIMIDQIREYYSHLKDGGG